MDTRTGGRIAWGHGGAAGIATLKLTLAGKYLARNAARGLGYPSVPGPSAPAGSCRGIARFFPDSGRGIDQRIVMVKVCDCLQIVPSTYVPPSSTVNV